MKLPPWIVASPLAHRGLHDLTKGIPENTTPAFEASVAAGYGVELDVQQLADGTLVVFHDDGLKRAAGVDVPLRNVSYEILRRHGLFGTDLRAPKLSEVLRVIASRVPIMLEIKHAGRTTQVARRVHAEIRDYRGPLAVQSFNPFVMAWFRANTTDLPLGQLGGPLEDDLIAPLDRFASRRLVTVAISRPDFINYDLRGLPDAWVQRIAKLTRRPLLCWTVRTEHDRIKAERLGLNYVFEGVRP